MKENPSHRKPRTWVLALVLLLSAAPIRAQYVLDLGSIDYFTSSGDIPVAPTGGQAEIEFGFYNGGPAASVLRSTVLQAVEDADCSHIITDAAVTYTYGNYGGKITLTIEPNMEEYREVEVDASTGSVTLTQDVRGSAVYTLTRVNPSSGAVWHGQTVHFRLSGSDTFATYQLCRTEGNVVTFSDPVQGTGSPLNFTDHHGGTYTAQSDYPSLVAMNGSITVNYLAFYGYAHSFSPVSVLDPDGGTLTVPFTRNPSSSLSEMNTILSAYNGGQSAEWDDTMPIT